MSEQSQLLATIQALEAQRSLLGDAAVDAAVNALKAQLQTLAQPAPESAAPFSGERKLVTIMFADISGFTALSERMDPEEVRALMNACFDDLVPVIQRYDGTIDKFIGDEIMALFGAPRALEKHAECACYAALAMMDALKEFNRKYGADLDMHIGLNTGPVIAGGIGSEGRQQYSVIGDAVNLAARLKDAARPGEIFAGAETYALTAQRFDFFALPPMRLKGKKELIQIHSLHQIKAGGESPWGDRLRSTLVGRREELGAIRSTLQDLKSGRGSCLALIGEAGQGKSRLIAETRQQAGPVQWVEGRALSYTRQSSYQLAVEILRKLIDAPAELPDELVRARLRLALELVNPAQAADRFPLLVYFLQLPLREEEKESISFLGAERLRELMHQAFREYLADKAGRPALVLVWEDLHWADPSSLMLLEQLLDLSREHPILFLLLFRPQTEERIWNLHERFKENLGADYRVLTLENLSAQECGALACNLLRIDRLSPEVEKLIFEKAEGNPFFIEELLRSLLDNGMLFIEQLEIQAAGNLNHLNLPSTLQGVIASRIDQLEPTEKMVLQIASVLGRFFHYQVLATLLGQVDSRTKVHQALFTLLRRELIREKEGEKETYVFKHAVTHEVAYQSLLLADRRRLHLLAGEAIEALSGDAKEEQYNALAFHYEQAEEVEKAVHYLRLAADHARGLFANEEAVSFFQRAIDLITRHELLEKESDSTHWPALLMNLEENLADIWQLTGKYEAARETYALAQNKLAPDDWITRARLERKIGMAFNAVSDFESMNKHFIQAKEFLQKSPLSRTPEWMSEWLEVHNDLIYLNYWIDNPEVMRSYSEIIQNDIEEYGRPDQKARFLSNQILTRFRLERFLLSESSIQFARRLYEVNKEIKNFKPAAFNAFLCAFAQLWYNETEEALRLFEEGLPMVEKIGDVVISSRFLTYMVVAHRRLNQLEEVKKLIPRSLTMAQSARMPEYVATTYANQVWVEWKEGNFKAAEAYHRQTLEIWNKLPATHSSLVFVWLTAWPMAATFFQCGNLPACIAELESILHPYRKRMEPEIEAHLAPLIADFKAGTLTNPEPALKMAFELARKYRYL